MSVYGPLAKPAAGQVEAAGRRFPRALVALGIFLFCVGMWLGLYLAGSQAVGAIAREVGMLEDR